MNKLKALKLLKKAQRLTSDNKDQFIDIQSDLNVLFEMVKSWTTGGYKKIPWKTIGLIVAGLVYLVNPLDVLPDFIPLLGFSDDLTFFAFIISSLKSDIKEYKKSKFDL
ncbi:MAG: DUF1232 domain-containing protein [Oligoflexia bacterium]|nr:DUF1232 domain-containing protein [Oligoflexia bacterium]